MVRNVTEVYSDTIPETEDDIEQDAEEREGLGELFAEANDSTQTTLEDLRVERLTKDRLVDHAIDADFVFLSVQPTIVPEPNFKRTVYADKLYEALNQVYSDWIPGSIINDRSLPGIHVKMEVQPDDYNTFPLFDFFFEQHMESWEKAAVSFVFNTNRKTKVDTAVFNRNDSMPPHPGCHKFMARYSNKTVLSTKEYRKQLEAWKDYYRMDTDKPRYSYELTKIIHGDHNAYGWDVFLHIFRNEYMGNIPFVPRFNRNTEYNYLTRENHRNELLLQTADELYDVYHPPVDAITDDIEKTLRESAVDFPPEITYYD